MFVGSTQIALRDILAKGAMKLEEVEKRLRVWGKLGFGVEAIDVISKGITSGAVLSFTDGDKTWLRLGAPFVRLERGNDWGYVYLAYKAKNDSGTCSAKHGITASEGQIVEIQWRDGSITHEPLVMRNAYASVSDHGQMVPTTVTSPVPGIMVTSRGVSAWTALDSEGLKVRSDAF